MMMRQPQEFARVARQWAVRYAGAPPKPEDENQIDLTGEETTEDDDLAR